MRHFIEVSFPDPIGDGTLTYHYDSENEIPQEGARALVFVRNRRIIGYITKVHQNQPDFQTRPVSTILDPIPLLSPNMLKLAFRVARDCVCKPGEVLHAMLPGGVKQTVQRLIRLTAKGQSIADVDPFEWLKQQDWANYSTFIDKFPGASRKVNDWVIDGTVEIGHQISQNAKPKMIKVLQINHETPIEIDKLTPKEKIVIELLLKNNCPMTSSSIQKAAGVSAGPVSQLKKKNLIVEREERIIREVAQGQYYEREATPAPSLSQDQANVLEALEKSDATDKRPVLVRGVTCSGKTEVYLRWVAETIAKGKSAIVLVPEISLTPQMMKRFKDRFGEKVAILHSKLSYGERFDQWEEIRRGHCPVVVGARSAVFAPTPNLGTIILDEEGEPSFKQADSPRYHAREVAQIRCQLENALLVMGSATPTIDSFQKCKNDDYVLVEMNQRVGDKLPPMVEVVDMRFELVTRKNRSMFSMALSREIKAALKDKKQVILFLNRRGYSSFVFCRECGEAVQCSKCNVSLVYHAGSKILRCHYCGEIKQVPQTCPNCQSAKIKFYGGGTQRVEAEAKRYFPEARVERLDSDTVGPKGNMEEILDAFGQKKIDILIGTQMVAKGLDFPDVTVVGILAADSLLRIPDFRASERNFSLLAQVAGRAGRGDTPGRVVLQTYYPDHHSIKFAVTEDYYGFFETEALMRKEAIFPPFTELASFIVTSEIEDKAREISSLLGDKLLEQSEKPGFQLLGPVPAAIERIHGKYRYQLVLKMLSLEELVITIDKAMNEIKVPHNTRISIDVNPYFML